MSKKLKIVEDGPKSFKIQRPDGKVIHVAKTKDTDHIYKLAGGGLIDEAMKLAPLAMKVAPLLLNKGGETEGRVPGKAKVAGDSVKNDTVDAKLSPGEIVIPRSIASDPKKAMAFIQEALAGKHPATGTKHADGGMLDAYQNAVNTGQSPMMTSANDLVAQAQANNASMNIGRPVVDPAAQGTSPFLAGTPTGAPQLGAGPLADPTMAASSVADPLAAGAAMSAQQLDPRNNMQMGANPQGTPMPSEALDTPAGTTAVKPGGDDVAGAQPGNGMVSQSQFSHTSESMNPDQKAAVGKYDKLTDDLYKTSLEAGHVEQQNRLAQATGEYNTIMESNAKFQAFEEKKQQEVDRRLQDIRNVEEKFAGMSVDGGRFYGDGITGAKIMAGIGLALGTLGGAGAVNNVNNIIEKAIDRDIEVQKANISKVGKEVDMARGGLADYLAVTHDMETAMMAEKARMLEAVGKQFEAIAASNSNAAVKQKALEKVAPLTAQAAELHLKVGKNVDTFMRATAPMSAEAYKDERERRVQDPATGATMGYALTGKDAAEVKEISEKKRTADQGINELINISKMSPIQQQAPTVRARAQTLHDQLIGVMKDPLFGSGKINHAEIDLIGDIIRDPTKVFTLSSSNRKALETVQGQLDESYHSLLNTRMDQSTRRRDASQDMTPVGKTPPMRQKNIIKGKRH